MGAVSMFGGVDIAAAVKKRTDSLSPEGKQDKGKHRKFCLGLSTVTRLNFDSKKAVMAHSHRNSAGPVPGLG